MSRSSSISRTLQLVSPLICALAFLMAGAPLVGQEVPLFPLGEAAATGEVEQTNVLFYGLDLSSAYDDQSTDDPGTGVHAFIQSAQPHVRWQMARRRWETSMNYRTAFAYSSERISGYDTLSQFLGFTLKHRLSKRLTLAVRNNFTRTSNPFDSLPANSVVLPQSGLLDQPNTTVPISNTSRRMEQVGFTPSYRLGPKSTLRLDGSFTLLDYKQPGASDFDPSLRSVGESGNVFYVRQVRKRSSTGIGYAFQQLDFGHGSVRTEAHTVLAFWNVAPTPKFVISVFGGPEHSATSGITTGDPAVDLMDASGWSWSGGSTVSWSAGHSWLNGSVIRRVSDGGGARGNVVVNSFQAQANHKFSSRSIVNAYFTFSQNSPLLRLVDSPASFNYIAGTVGFERQLSEHCWLNFFYSRVQQRNGSGQDTFAAGSRAGIQLSIKGQRRLGSH